MRFRRPGLLQEGLALVAEHLAVWPLLLAEEQQHPMNDTDQLMASKTWEAARGFTRRRHGACDRRRVGRPARAGPKP